MLIHNHQKRRWVGMAALLIAPGILSAQLTFAQGDKPAAAPPAEDMAPAVIPMTPKAAAPAPPDLTPAEAPAEAPASEADVIPMGQPATARASSGCAPGRIGCTTGANPCVPRSASTIVCQPAVPGVGVCGPGGNCNTARSCQSDGVARLSGPCGPNGCSTGDCNNGYGMPCMAGDGNCFSPEVCMGRPYTVGDLKRDVFGFKCKVKDGLGLNGCGQCSPLQQWWMEQQYRSNCRRAYRNHVLAAHIHNKFNYFFPSGCCGEGCAPFGCYNRVYAVTPHYTDPRDSQVFASPMTGLPMVVPVAPNVRHQYNYSWGNPASRVTQISNVVLPRR